MKSLLTLFTAAVALACVSCGTSTEFTAGAKPASPYEAVVIRDFAYKAEEPEARGPELTKQFTPVLKEELENTRKFAKVTAGGAASKAHALRVEGEVTYLAEGNDALRIGVGFGAGKSHFYCTARYLDNTTGKLIGTLQVERSSKSGMMGIADNFLLIRRAAAEDVAAKAAEFTTAN
jgi:hypothetical protein